MSIDPDVATTDQPYVFTGDDPLNAEDPLGLGAYQPKRWNKAEAEAEKNRSEGKPYDKDDYKSAQDKAKTNQKNGWNAEGTARGPVRGHSGVDQVQPTPGQRFNFSGIPDQFVHGIESIAASPVTQAAVKVGGGLALGWFIVIVIAGAPVGA